MGRRLLFGVVWVVSVLSSTARPEAAPLKVAAQIKLTSGTINGESTLRAEGRGVTFVKRVGKDHVVMRIEVPRDRIDLEVTADGGMRIVRNGKVLRLQMKHNVEKAIAQVQKLTSGSPALAGFEALMAGLADDGRPEAQSVMVSYALLHAVRGNAAPARAVASRAAPRANSAVVRAMDRSLGEGPYACWAEYASTVDQYVVEFNACIEDYWWIPGWTAACGLQFAVQGELAWFWLLSCSGGMPV